MTYYTCFEFVDLRFGLILLFMLNRLLYRRSRLSDLCTHVIASGTHLETGFRILLAIVDFNFGI